MKKLISILGVILIILCVNGDSYADNESESNSIVLIESEGTNVEAVAEGGETTVESIIEGKQEQNFEQKKNIYSSTINYHSSQGKDEVGFSSPFGGIINSDSSVDEKLEKKNMVILNYKDMGLLNKEQGEIEASRDTQEFNSDLRRKKDRATLGILPGTGNKILDLILGTKPVWPSSNSQAKAVKSFNKINKLEIQILEAEFELGDAQEETITIQLNKKIAEKKKSLEKEKARFILYNEQSKRIMKIR